MERRWKILQAPCEKVTRLQESLKISPILCRILVQRGVETFEDARNFFRPELSHLHDPMLMKDMDKAVNRVLSAIDNKEKILIYGDYDVDGTTAVSCMYRFMRNICDPGMLSFYIPHRYREGYGISRAGIEYAHAHGYQLVISLDCGIKSVELIRYARQLGIDFIVCDHHLPDSELPPAVAILNPKQKDCGYPYKELCGCGVGFKLITALAPYIGIPLEECYQFLDLVATAIAADIVPITGENRVLAYYGIKRVNENPSPGIRALIELSGLKKTVLNVNNLVFVIAPRVNAAGRMDDAKKAVFLFTEDDYTKALEFAGMLHSDNDDRKEADLTITSEALSMIEKDAELAGRKSTVVFQNHWHKGVVGIVASRLIERYYRPTVVLTQSGEFVAGSARSVAGFNLYEAIHACRDHLLGYGGHFAAAGVTLTPEMVEPFSRKFEEIVAATIQPEQLIPVIHIDAEAEFRDLTHSFYNILCQMEPFGPENLRPVFIARSVWNHGSRIVKEQHIRFTLQQNGRTMNGIGFNLSHKFDLLDFKQPLDFAFALDENEWNGQKSLQLKVVDFRLSAE